MTLDYAFLTGPDIVPALDAVAQLRIRVFRDFPYLYDGTVDYERDYLATFAKAQGAIVVVASEAGRIVGASTGCRLESEHEAFKRPFVSSGMKVDEIFYCAESVMLPQHRGQGAGNRFFALRESHGRGLGCRQSVFCAVVRPSDHSARPPNYQPLDGFWQKRGYQQLPGFVTNFSWRDVGESHDTEKSMQFWMKDL